ncbi:MAG TPA: hypothetical protein VK150_02485, partial [Geothrix sp.]|nr:hypothetical protein [Geothrix sp.]
LHAVALKFSHPVTGKQIRLTSPLPKELARLFEPKKKPSRPSDPAAPRHGDTKARRPRPGEKP